VTGDASRTALSGYTAGRDSSVASGVLRSAAEREVWDPLKQFIYSLLSSLTKTEIAHQVVRDLEARFGSWEKLRDASIAEIEDTIRAVTLTEQKAVHLKQC
jgi:endonuclease III